MNTDKRITIFLSGFYMEQAPSATKSFRFSKKPHSMRRKALVGVTNTPLHLLYNLVEHYQNLFASGVKYCRQLATPFYFPCQVLLTPTGTGTIRVLFLPDG